jgi:Peptidase A4 family
MHRRLPRLALGALAAAGLVMAMAPAAGAAASPSQAVRAKEVAVNALRHLDIGQHATNHVTFGHARSITASTPVSSTNWSGYADTGSGFDKVTGTWTEPTATCSGSTTSLAAFWVGIDGYSSSTVEQDGTLVECYEGTKYQYTWWEMYPTNDIEVVGSTVAAGDAISASVVRTGTSYALKVTDSTHTANSFSTTQTCSASSCVDSSAEWIAEAPSGSSGVYPLTQFSLWTLANATVGTTSSSGVISTYTNYEITMVNGSTVKAQPSALNSAGNSFTVTWKHS